MSYSRRLLLYLWAGIRGVLVSLSRSATSASHYGGSQLVGGVFIYLCVIRRHFRWIRADNGGNIFFAKYGGPSGGSQQSGGKHFFHEIRWPVRWSLLLGGGIIILHVIRRHFLAAAWPQLLASPRTVLFRWKSVVYPVDHVAPRAPGRWSGRQRGLGRGRRGAGEDATAVAHPVRSTRVHWFGCGVRLPSPQNHRGCG